MADTFIDTHCHLFNFVDIPVYETLDGKVSMNTAVKMLAAFSASGALLSGIVRNKIHDYKDFIQFFERPQSENIKAFVDEVAAADGADELILTPLVMDFDCVRQEKCGGNCNPCMNRNCPLPDAQPTTDAQDPSAGQQLLRLVETIRHVEQSGGFPDGKSVKLYPFLGFDLRKLTPPNSTAMEDLKQLWEEVGVTKQERQRGFTGIANGKVLGIKLYPPIGFNPYPKNKRVLEKYLLFYEWCIEQQIPLTVHCQSGSYSAGRKKREVDGDTHGANWLNLFEDWKAGKLGSQKDISELRINFAHFGGEQGIEDMLDPFRMDGIDEDSWTYALVTLMMNFPHTYADVSAYDWSEKNAVKNFAKILDMDKEGKLIAGKYKLTDKLLWGSDVPMVLDSKSYMKGKRRTGEAKYTHLMQNFRDGVFKSKKLNTDEKNNVISQMTCHSPTRFLLS